MKHVVISDRFDHIDAAGSAAGRRYLGAPKRLFDIVLALVILPVVAPILALLWVLTRLDGGPGFFGQERVGKDGRRFTCWKLRTMVVDAERVLADLCASDPTVAEEWHVNQKLAKDPRITGVGRFLRKSSLDELPQILNILWGDMSFVGPRPFTVGQEHLYVAAGGTAYFHLRPGVTGSWQIEGRGTTRFVDRVRFDEDYYSKASLGCDLRLIGKTFGVVLKGTGH